MQTVTYFLPRDGALDDLRQLLVQQRLAAGDDDDGRAAFVDRLQTIGERQPLVENLVRIIDLAAAGAGEIAAKQRLEHEHERKALLAGETLAQHVAADLGHLQQ